MKTCPRCNRTYPDSENFCEADSSALISSPAFTQQASSRIECPVCGGKAEPGEVICNFCGARLEPNQPSQPATPASSQSQTTAQTAKSAASPYPRLGGAVTQVRAPTTQIASGSEPESGRSILGTAGYVVAAIIALAAGAWFAIHLSSGKPSEETAAVSSPAGASSPVAGMGEPVVVLANAMPVQVSGPASTAPERSSDAIRKAFDDNRGSIADAYSLALASDPKVADGMMVRLKIRGDGSVDSGAVRISTAADPSLDAKITGAMIGWKLPATSAGEVDVDYPIILAHDNSEESRIESDLQAKLAALSPTETPEYASAPEPEASPLAAPSVEAAIAPTPEAVPSPAPAPEVVTKPRHHPRKETAALPPPPAASLFQQVQDRLKSNPKLRRVKAYTTGGVVTLFGKVFDDSDKSLAIESVRSIPGVTSVVDTMTTDEAEWGEQQTRIAQQLANSGLDKVTVKVIGHDAFLNGEVKTPLEKDRAVTVAEGAAPVTVRENLIRVIPGGMFGF